MSFGRTKHGEPIFETADRHGFLRAELQDAAQFLALLANQSCAGKNKDMKRAIGHAVLSASLLGRLSGFDMADLGPHASLLYRELITSASSGLPASTIILAAAIVRYCPA